MRSALDGGSSLALHASAGSKPGLQRQNELFRNRPRIPVGIEGNKTDLSAHECVDQPRLLLDTNVRPDVACLYPGTQLRFQPEQSALVRLDDRLPERRSNQRDLQSRQVGAARVRMAAVA